METLLPYVPLFLVAWAVMIGGLLLLFRGSRPPQEGRHGDSD
jgi:hypothetical protein